MALGEVRGVKLILVVLLALGCWGMFDWLRHAAGLGPLAAGFGALAYATAAWYPGRLHDGNYDELSLVLAPLVLALGARLARGRPGGGWLPLVFATALAQAKYAAGVFLAGALVVVLCEPDGTHGPRRRALLGLAAAFLVGVALALPKLLPLLELLRSDLVPQQSYAQEIYFPGLVDLALAFHERLLDKWSLGLSLPVLALALLGLRGADRGRRGPLVVLALTAWVCLDPGMALSPWRVLGGLPLLRTMKDPIKYANIWMLFGAVALAARGLGTLERAASGRGPAWRVLVALVAAGALLPQLGPTRRAYATLFFRPDTLPRETRLRGQVAHAAFRGQVERYRFD